MTTTMHFGPEWMRTKSSQSVNQLHSPSSSSGPQAQSASYSALLSSVPSPQAERDEAHPFRYSKDEMLRIYKENTSKAGLGLEVERWEGVVRETAAEPISLREMSEQEKKLFAGPLNSELRRRQSSDYLSPLSTQNLGLDRNRLNSASASPLRDRFPIPMKRRDSTDQLASGPPRRLSLSGSQPLNSPRDVALPSPRTRYGPGFDGVLNSGESWMMRRRTSEGVLRGGTSRETSGDDNETSGREIKEEDETPQETDTLNPLPSNEPDNATEKVEAGLEIGVAQLHLDNTGQTNAIGPPGLADLASVEWSYLDPQGQVQGPFRADVMQKWNDEGYFTPDLLIKRPAHDKDWISVGALARHSLGDKIFLSPFAPPQPPGIPRRTESPPHDPSLFIGPYQPSPIRSLRASALDSYNPGSNSSSPASSFGAGRFGDNSPDPNAFGDRLGGSYSSTDPSIVSHVGSFAAEPSSLGRTGAFNEAAVIGNLGVTRTGSTDSMTYNNVLGTWPSASSSLESMPLPSGFGSTGIPAGTAYHNHLQARDNSFSDPSSGNVPFDYGSFVDVSNQNLERRDSNFPGLGGMQYSPQMSYAPSTGTIPSVASASRVVQNGSSIPDARRPGPFDPTHPTASNTIVINEVRAPDPAPIVLPPTAEPVERRQVRDEPMNTSGAIPETHAIPEPVSIPVEPAAQIEEAVISTPPSKKTRAKSSSQASKSAVIVTAPVETPVTPPPPTVPPKAAWVKDDDKTKPSGVSLSLREIQDAEMRKAEARKAAERERERAARTAVTTNSESTPAFTASWGLPSSQVGARALASQTKDSPVTASPSTPSAPVWTTATKPTAAKTMKEIQEEEERQKKVASKETAAAIARRAYGDAPAPKSNPTQNPWTTVGPSGKATPASRPPSTSAASAVSTPRTNGTVAPQPTRTASNAGNAKVTPVTAKADDTPPPSHEFVRWLSESLKGLNSSVNVEEIMSMLLSFPLDPDPSTVELISDLIYANSTTLDGRRYATEFTSRRKADAASRPKGAGTNGGGGKPVSIADVVKSQPKPPASSEWGGFKIVNKKKKSTRT